MKTLPWIIIVLLLVVILLQRECSHRPECPPVRVDTIPGDTVFTISNIPIYKPVYIDTVNWQKVQINRESDSTKWANEPIDTTEIIKEFYSRQIYKRTLKDDSSAYIFLTDTVTQNRLLESRLIFQNRRPCSIIDNSYGRIQLNNSPIGLYAGFALGRSSREFGIGPSMMLLRKNSCYSVVYDMTNKDLYFNFSAPIWKPKKVP